MRSGLRTLLENSAGVQVVGEAANGPAAINLARELAPDIVLVPVDLPELGGIETARQLPGRLPGSPRGAALAT